MTIRRRAAKRIKKALARGKDKRIARIAGNMMAADLSSIWQLFDREEKLFLFNALSSDKKVRLFENLSPDLQKEIIRIWDKKRLPDILNRMAPDNRADLFSSLPPFLREKLLRLMNSEEARDVKELLEYGEDTAGGRMTTDFISLDGEMTSRQALIFLQKKSGSRQSRNIYALYATDKQGRLGSGISLQRLIASAPEAKIKDLARPVDKIKVNLNDDQEQVAELFEHYDLLSVPVVDKENRLAGVITIDDIIDVIQQEASEDIAIHAGMDEIDYSRPGIGRSVRTRAPWLMTSFAGGLAAAVIIGLFEGALEKVAALAVFIPVIMDMGGNVGVQSSTVVVRRLALEKDKSKWRNSVSGELRAGLIMSGAFGLLLWAFASWRYTPEIGRASGLGIAAALVLSACMGAFLPVIFYKKDIDPAVSTGPLITTAIDVLGLGIYFLLALWIVL